MLGRNPRALGSRCGSQQERCVTLRGPESDVSSTLKGRRGHRLIDGDGVWGYRDLLAALADPSRSEAHESSELKEMSFDPWQFSVEIVDARVGARLKSPSA
jgi:hypothetical protein